MYRSVEQKVREKVLTRQWGFRLSKMDRLESVSSSGEEFSEEAVDSAAAEVES